MSKEVMKKLKEMEHSSLWGSIAIAGLIFVTGTSTMYYITRDIRNLEKKLTQPIIENVIQGPEPEKFYILNNKRAYIEIDAKPIEEK